MDKNSFNKFAAVIKNIYSVINALLTIVALVVLINVASSRRFGSTRYDSFYESYDAVNYDTKEMKKLISDYKASPDKDEIIFSQRNGEVDLFLIKNRGLNPSGGGDPLFIDNSSINSRYSKRPFVGYAQEDYSGSSVVNFIFNKNGGESEIKLFPENVFVYQYIIARSPLAISIRREAYLFDSYPEDDLTIDNIKKDTDKKDYCEKNIYFVIASDTNGDGVLNKDDDIALYLSDYDGANLKKLSSNMFMFKRLDNYSIIYSDCIKAGETKIYSYDYKTGKASLLRTDTSNKIVKNLSLSAYYGE